MREAPLPLEDYALIGDLRSAALVGRDGAIDWLCLPRFDQPACLTALLGGPRHGTWSIAPEEEVIAVERRYRGDTLVLETVFTTADGEVALIDAMPTDLGSDLGGLSGAAGSHLVRRVEGRRGTVRMRFFLKLRFDYGSTVPWVTRLRVGHGITAIAGPHRVTVRSPVTLEGRDLASEACFDVARGQAVTFVMSHSASHLPAPAPIDAEAALAMTERSWREWSARCTHDGPWRDAVMRSLIVLKALTYAPTGGIVAAPTTSLPEKVGGARNWDYRFCWLRDAALTLVALIEAGYYDEAQAWRDWLHRSIAGSGDALQIMYGVSGERHLLEWEADWLPGYAGSRPVRIGNAAAGQLQLDVYGEVMDALHLARSGGLDVPRSAWDLQIVMIAHLEKIWRQPDEGIWEVRGGRRQFVHSKVMAWVAFDRVVRDAESHGLPGPVDRWRAARDAIHAQVCDEGFDTELGSFVQSYGSHDLDAALLLIPLVGFLPADDPRVAGTVSAIRRDLDVDGFLLRYRSDAAADGLAPGEGAFLPCTFWLAEVLSLLGEHDEAEGLLTRLLALRNDVGLLSEEYDTAARRLVGNFPQAFSHLAAVSSALNLQGRRRASGSLVDATGAGKGSKASDG